MGKDDIPLTGETVSQRIVAAMQHAGLRKVHLADRVGVSWTSVNAWTKGRPPKAPNLLLIAQVTGVSFEWLQSGKGPALVESTVEPLHPVRTPAAFDEFVAEFGERFSGWVIDQLRGVAFDRDGRTPSVGTYLDLARALERVPRSEVDDGEFIRARKKH
ncbi:MAG: helix-turn-helix transcriptional regulator [Myxococcota bacterium]